MQVSKKLLDMSRAIPLTTAELAPAHATEILVIKRGPALLVKKKATVFPVVESQLESVMF